MFKKEFVSNVMSVLAVGIYSISLADILTLLVLATALILNVINIVHKLKSKKDNPTS